MSINFPTSLDTLTNPTSTSAVATVDHAAQHANANDAIEALEAKVGVDGSAVTTSHDYKLSTITSTDKAVGVSATQTLTNKTLTSPTINTPAIVGGNFTSGTMVTGIINGTTAISLGSDATGDVYYRNASGNLQRVAIGANNKVLTSNGTIPSWQDAQTSSVNSTSGVAFGPTASGTVTITHGLGRTPVIVRINGIGEVGATNGTSPTSYGTYSSSGNRCVYLPYATSIVGPIKSSTIAIHNYVTSNDGYGVISNVNATTFDLYWTVTGNISASVYHWEAQ